MNSDEIYEKVETAVAEALALEEDEVQPSSTLMSDLGAESIDLLDILFRIERSVGVKIQATDLADHVQGGIPDEEFSDEETNVVTQTGMAHLKTVMPQLAEMDLDGKLAPEDVMDQLTVQNLADLAESRAATSAS